MTQRYINHRRRPYSEDFRMKVKAGIAFLIAGFIAVVIFFVICLVVYQATKDFIHIP